MARMTAAAAAIVKRSRAYIGGSSQFPGVTNWKRRCLRTLHNCNFDRAWQNFWLCGQELIVAPLLLNRDAMLPITHTRFYTQKWVEKPPITDRQSATDHLQTHWLSSKPPASNVEDDSINSENLSIFQRFKRAYKEHGKILIGIHIVTSAVWVGSFYYLVRSGFDVVPFLRKLGVGETLVKPFTNTGLGTAAMVYLLYKLATPARYTVTLGGTNMYIRYLRSKGKMQPVPEGDRLRELYRDSKDQLKQKRKEIKGKRRQGTQQKARPK